MRKNQVNLECAFCKKSYFVKLSHSSKSRFCSIICKNSMQKIELAGRKMPPACRPDKFGPHSRLGFAKKCGHLTKKGRNYCAKCRNEVYPEHKIKCIVCSSEMSLSNSEAKKYKCCSMDCRNKSISIRQSGAKSHFWRGGLASENEKLRNGKKCNDWRKLVFERDDYTCQICGVRGGKLTADHIKQWSLYPALRFDLQNGRTLCRTCHQKTENFGGRALAEIKRRECNGKLQYELI